MSSDLNVATPPVKPVLVFDGDCQFCSRWIGRWRQTNGEAVDYLPSQDPAVAARFPEIPRTRFDAAVQLVETDGQVYSAAEAVLRALAHAPGRQWPLRVYQASALVAQATEFLYRLVATHRGFFSRLTGWLWGRSVEAPSYALAQFLFLRCLGLIYLVAFLSLGSQLAGLIGHHGILPVDRFLAALGREYDASGVGIDRYRLLPTLSWLQSSDSFLNLQCAVGAMASLALLAGLAQVPCLVLLWLLYLSLSVVGREFFGYQWDNLLLETGFLAIFVAPTRWWLKAPSTPFDPRLARFLLRLLLFKLMFSSGWVKLSSHDSTWRDLTALAFHYQTQPLPTCAAWYANQWPLWFHKLSCGVMFALELGAPLLIFAPRRPRLLGCGLLVLLQLLILATGNYAFFNWLTLALCLLLVDDVALARLLPKRMSRSARPTVTRAAPWRRAVTALVALVFVPTSCLQIAHSTGAHLAWAAPMAALETWLDPLRTVSGYGLFAVMTSERREIVIEGSDDGETWLAYELRYKPGEVNRRPSLVAPHQPRLDWQMWFAALGSYRHNPWFVHFCLRLLQGSRPVLALLAKNPFPEHPPRYLRAELYNYSFTEASERRATGAWWKREHIGEYLPRVSLDDFGR